MIYTAAIGNVTYRQIRNTTKSQNLSVSRLVLQLLLLNPLKPVAPFTKMV